MLLVDNSQLHNLITFKLCCKYCYHYIIITNVHCYYLSIIIIIIAINNLYTATGSPGYSGLACDDGERMVHQENKDKMVFEDLPVIKDYLEIPYFVTCPTQGEQGEPGPQGEKGDWGHNGLPRHPRKKGKPCKDYYGYYGKPGEPGYPGIPGMKGKPGHPGPKGEGETSWWRYQWNYNSQLSYCKYSYSNQLATKQLCFSVILKPFLKPNSLW